MDGDGKEHVRVVIAFLGFTGPMYFDAMLIGNGCGFFSLKS